MFIFFTLKTVEFIFLKYKLIHPSIIIKFNIHFKDTRKQRFKFTFVPRCFGSVYARSSYANISSLPNVYYTFHIVSVQTKKPTQHRFNNLSSKSISSV